MQNATPETSVNPWQMVMLFLNVYVLTALAAETFFSLPVEVSRLLLYADTLVCCVFLGDFVANLIQAKSKLAYLRWGWIDLVSSIPYVPFLRWGRIVRVLRILRVLRAFRSTKELFAYLFINRAKGILATVATLSFIVVVFSSIAILNVEIGEGVNITNAEEALWWSFVTITTVGYGDFYPVTGAGRLIAALLMTVGVGLFGTFTAYIASLFLEPTGEKEDHGGMLEELRQLRAEVAQRDAFWLEHVHRSKERELAEQETEVESGEL
jgi:voltage-gated potassium channel